MKEIIENLHSPAWWFTAVVMGTIASIFGAIILRIFPAITKKLVSLYIDSSHKRKTYRQMQICTLINNQNAYLYMLSHLNMLKTLSDIYFVLSIGTITVVQGLHGKLATVVWQASGLFMVFSFCYQFLGSNIESIITESFRRRKNLS